MGPVQDPAGHATEMITGPCPPPTQDAGSDSATPDPYAARVSSARPNNSA